MLRLRLFIPWLLFLLILQSKALAQSDPTPSLIAFEIKLEDDPTKAPALAREQLPSIDPKQNPQLYLRTLWLAFEVHHPDSKPLFALLPGALSLAESLGLKEEWLRLKMHAMRLEKFLNQSSKDELYYKTLIQEARRVDVPRLLARILFDYAFYLEEKGDLTSSLRHQEEAYQLMLRYPMTEFDQALLKNLMAIHLVQQGQQDKALPMMLEVAHYCEKAQVRAFAAVALYNLARHYDLKQTVEGALAARPWFTASLNAARAVRDREMLASGEFGLGSVALTLKEWTRAQTYLKSALKQFMEQQDSHWTAETLILLARLARLQDRSAEALEFLGRTQVLLSADDKKLQNKINEEYALAYLAVGNFAKAAEYSQATLLATRKLFEQQQRDEYQRRTIQMGLLVEEERNKVLLRENELQAQKLKQAEAFQIYAIVLSLLLLGMGVFIGLAIVQTFRIRKSKAKMREILDHIEEGILTFDRDLNIEAEYSAYLQEFTQTQQSLQGRSLQSTLLQRSTLHDEDKSMVLEALRFSMGEPSLAWELNESQLPRELIFQSQQQHIAALHWVPMFDPHGILKRVLLTLRDVTEERHLSARVAQQEFRELNLQTKVAELLDASMPSVVQLLDDTEALWKDKGDSERWTPQETRLHLHTVKGIARGIGLKSLSHAIHDLEDSFLHPDLDIRDRSWTTFFESLAQYRQLVGQVFRASDHPRSLIQKNLPAVVAELLPAFVEQMDKGACEVATCLVEDSVLQWPDQLLKDLRNILVHVFSNCADHGFIQARAKTPKPAQLAVRAFRLQGEIHVHITDNGQGLREDVLVRAAEERGFRPSSSETVYDVVFHEGLSTSTGVDITSGRGIGLAYVAASCKAWQGEAHIRPDASTGGTRVELSFQLPPSTPRLSA